VKNLKIVKEVFNLFPRKDQARLILVILIQFFLSLLDLVAIALIGVLGSVAVTGVASRQNGNRVNSVLNFLHLNNSGFYRQIAILSTMSAGLFIIRTILSVFLTKKTLFFISRKSALLSIRLVRNIFSQTLEKINEYSEQETLYATTTGIQLLSLGVIGNGITIIADASLLFVILIGLLLVDPSITIMIIFIFVLLGTALYKFMKNKADKIGNFEFEYGVKSNQLIIEFLRTYREIVVQNKREYYITEIGNLRKNLAALQAERTFLPNISKYVFETTVILGSLSIAGLNIALQDASHAVASLAIFLASGSRIAPAILRIQQGTITIRSSIASAGNTLEMFKANTKSEIQTNKLDKNFQNIKFVPEIKINNVSFKYPGTDNFVLNKISFEVKEGQQFALVGPSGGGKSTLVDIMLGMYEPQTGDVKISNQKPLSAFSLWPGEIAYVPQSASILMGTFRDNIALGGDKKNYPDSKFWDALKYAQLDDYVRSLPRGLDTNVGDQGLKLSGGQRQRLGVARAVFKNPRLLILDEATSALDVETENAFIKMLEQIKGKITVIVIAHRLSSIQNADLIAYVSKGEILAISNFTDLRKLIPDFNKQVLLLGIQ